VAGAPPGSTQTTHKSDSNDFAGRHPCQPSTSWNDERLVFMLQLAESSLTSISYRQILGASRGPSEHVLGRRGRVDQRERGSVDAAVGLVIDP
jgi:hypothetical protein